MARQRIATAPDQHHFDWRTPFGMMLRRNATDFFVEVIAGKGFPFSRRCTSFQLLLAKFAAHSHSRIREFHVRIPPILLGMNIKEISLILENSLAGSLGTISDVGAPFVSLVTVAATGPRSVAMLLSGLAVHTKNLIRNPAASLLLVSPGGETGDPLAGARVTLTGTVRKLTREHDEAVRSVFLAKHPSAALYADFGDFSFFVFEIDQAHLVAGFGKIVTVSGVELN
jgi:hypothetical protein